MTQFSNLGLSEKIISAITKAQYNNPTPIQEKTIPIVLQCEDLIGIAQTGTGKTAAFVLPILQFLEQKRSRARLPRFLILEPTRELALQVEESFNKFMVTPKPNIVVLIGGVSFEEQEKKLRRGVDVIIATPGRFLDQFQRGQILMRGLELFVIDEADRMLDMGFIPDVEKISSFLPIKRQTLLFSATMPQEINHLAQKFLKNPKNIQVSPIYSTAQTVEQKFVSSPSSDATKRALLRSILRKEETNLKNAIIFCNRKKDVSTLLHSLLRHKYNAGALHGDIDQHTRTKILNSFKEKELTILVASDVAARGLDIPEVSHVFNFDVPLHAEDYVHRIGRTGRAGRAGKAFTIVTETETNNLEAIKKINNDKIEWVEICVETIAKTSSANNVSNNVKNFDKDQDLKQENKTIGFGKYIPAFMLVTTKE